MDVARQMFPKTTVIPTAMDHNVCIRDEPTTHLLSGQNHVNTFHDSDFVQLDFPTDLQKNNNGHLLRYSKQAVRFLFGFVWMTFCCLVYIFQHSLYMDPGGVVTVS